MEKILTTASGRYKVLKLIQYISRTLLLHAKHRRIKLSMNLRDKLRILISQCSIQRRILQLGNLYRPIKYLLIQPKYTIERKFDWHQILSALAALTEDFSEDALTLSQLGWLPASFQGLAIYADRAWLISLILDLRIWTLQKHRILTKKRMEKLLDQSPDKEAVQARKIELREEEWWLDLDGLKTMCDTGQAWCDVFDVQVFDGFAVYCALTSAILGMYKFVGR